MDILFLTASAGGGHLKAAEAIMEKTLKRFPKTRTRIVDALDYTHPLLGKLVIGGYLNTVRNVPVLYGKLYELAERRDSINSFSKYINRLFSYRIERLIREFQPAAVVCTHIFPFQMATELKRKGKITVPVVGVITDFGTHSLWARCRADAYIVAHEYMRQEMIKQGIEGSLVHSVGIPVSDAFRQKKDRGMVLKKLGLRNKPTFLMMGGSLGYGEIYHTFLSLMDCNKDIQVIVLTGRNRRLKKKLEKLPLKMDKRVRIYGYTDKVAELMDASDFIITKPGGLTLAEALAKELPILLISPLPGQEERNAHFLLNNGAAASLLHKEEVESFFCQVMDNPLRVRHMKEMAKYLAKPESGEDIVKLIETLSGYVDQGEEPAIVEKVPVNPIQ